MEYIVGILTAVGLAAFGRASRFDKDRSFYPTVLIVIAFLYLLFAAIDGRTSVVLVEGVFTLLFSAVAVAGFNNGCRIVAVGIGAHGIFDFLHQFFITNTGVPLWWPGFCGTVDILVGIYIGVFVCRTGNAEKASEAG